MGSNMMRQSVPLLQPEIPIVGTGMEKTLAVDSRSAVVSKHSGTISKIDSKEIIIETDGQPEELELNKKEKFIKYSLKKFLRTNQNTCINQKPIVKLNQKIKKGDVIADGHSTYNGELALGRNLKVAYMPWRGYNFEDAIIINEKLMKT